MMNSLKEAYMNYKQYKYERTGSRRVSSNEFRALAEAVKKANRRGVRLEEASPSFRSRLRESGNRELNDLDIVVRNYRLTKKARLGESSVSYREVRALREAVEAANRRGVRLPEATLAFGRRIREEEAAAADAAQGQMDPSTAGAPIADPNDPNAVAQTAKTAIDQLTQLAAGGSAAGQPFDQNQQAGAPAAGQAPMQEACRRYRRRYGKIDEATFLKIKANYGRDLVESIGLTRDRIAMRAAKLDTLNENYKGDFASAYFNALGLKESKSPIEGIPSVDAICKGTADAPNGLAKELHTPVAWPDHNIKGEGVRQKESTSSVTDKYVEEFYAPKLSLDMIRESMKSGLLG